MLFGFPAVFIITMAVPLLLVLTTLLFFFLNQQIITGTFKVCYGNVPPFTCDTTFTAAATHRHGNNGASAPLFTGTNGSWGVTGRSWWWFYFMVISDHSGSILLDVVLLHPSNRAASLLPEGSSKVGHPGLGGPAGPYKFWLSFIVWWDQSIQAWFFTEKY